jgi:hypothetical protein
MIHLKALIIGLTLASPPVAAWMLRGEKSPPVAPEMTEVLNPPQTMAGATMTKIPVEIVSNGRAPKWVYVEAPVQSIPEPGVLPLTALAAALLLRRNRAGAKS